MSFIDSFIVRPRFPAFMVGDHLPTADSQASIGQFCSCRLLHRWRRSYSCTLTIYASIPCPCALCSLIDVFLCVVDFLVHSRYATAFFFFELSYLLIAIRLLSHHLQLATGLFVISLCRFFTLRTSLLSFETTQNHPDFFPSNALQKFSHPLHLYQRPVLSPPSVLT
jgi:hypothetical protein